MIDLNIAQQYLRSAGIDAWLLYDFRGSNPILWQTLGARKHTTRRCLLLIPRDGKPQLIVSPLDADLFADSGIPLLPYIGWHDLHAKLRSALAGFSRIAMEYSPGAAIPVMAHVDAGTIELIRSFGVEVVSSAGIYQQAAARWSDQSFNLHMTACRLVDQIKDAAFAFIGESISAGKTIGEYDVQQFIMNQFASNGLVTDEPPIVGVNANSGNPHYTPTAAKSSPIRRGDWVLIDLWAKHPDEQAVFADITWTGIVAPTPRPEHVRIFDIVTRARDAVVERLEAAWQTGQTLMGWQLDRISRNVIEQAGYGQQFFHRTGHSMGPAETPHALGVNLDDLETHDTRPVVPGVGFSVEPGIYLPEFGVRSEIDVYMHPRTGPMITTPKQTQIICVKS